MSFDFDATVVGAGAVGLACGRALANRGLSVLVLEREPHIGQGVSSRNSEVIHGGLYYPTGSLKARYCVQGRRLLYAFLESHKVDFRKCGKLVVATEAAEVPRIEAIFEQATANGVEGLAHLNGAQARALEPGLNAHAAILSPESGVFDSHGYMLALQGEIEDAGGSVVVSTPFERLIYPPPIPGALGTHYRKDLGGQAVFGPDLVYVETEDYSVDAAKAAEFEGYIRRFWPDLPDGALTPDYAGIRPKLHGPGEPQPDFQLHGREVHGLDGLVALFGIESPGLTSSLAIGEAVADKLGHD